MEENIKKVNIGYLLANILLPSAVVVLCLAVAVLFVDGGAAAALTIVPLFLAIFWWSFIGAAVYDRKKKKQLTQLDEQGFVRNHTFNSDGCTVALDLVHAQVALLFRWNPGKVWVLPASRISMAWVDDGRGGSGFMEGSSRVSFLLVVDGVTIRVNTFTSNKRWRMDSDHILTGISKADVMVEAINTARGQVA